MRMIYNNIFKCKYNVRINDYSFKYIWIVSMLLITFLFLLPHLFCNVFKMYCKSSSRHLQGVVKTNLKTSWKPTNVCWERLIAVFHNWFLAYMFICVHGPDYKNKQNSGKWTLREVRKVWHCKLLIFYPWLFF